LRGRRCRDYFANVVLRRLVVLFGIVLVVAAAVPPQGPAYHFHANKWPGGIVRFYNAATDQSCAVGQAVRAWNESGAQVRFIAVPRSSAQMVIEEHANKIYCAEGKATVGDARSAHVIIFPARGITHACNRYWAARVLAHELGHVLGLLHEDRYCATMNSTGSMRGGHECPKVVWEWRCRLLEPDDIAGVAAVYGGTPRPPTNPELCPLYPAIRPPSNVAATEAKGGGYVTFTFRRPKPAEIPDFVAPSAWKVHEGFVISAPAPTCARAAAAVPAQPRFRWRAQVGADQTFTTTAPTHHDCYAIWALDRLGRPSAVPATVIV
jgi:hypothetical protein